MAEEPKDKAAEAEAPEGASAPAPKKDPQMLLVLANAVLLLAALGVMVYTKILYKKPVIVEEVEIKKKQEELKTPAVPAERVQVPFEQIIVNIAMTSGKAHYATVAFTIECRDQAIAEQVKVKKAILVDKLIHALAKRQITELNTIQGKLLLKTLLIREYNELTTSGGVTDLYFSTFILQ